MTTLQKKIISYGISQSEIARRARVHRACVHLYVTKQKQRVGRDARRRIDVVLVDLGIMQRRDWRPRVAKKMKAFRRAIPHVVANIRVMRTENNGAAYIPEWTKLPTDYAD